MKCGFVGLIGRPNVGKSTLLNRILGQKIAIASPRPQTTRNRLTGVRNLPGAQLALVDTPGLHRPEGRGRSHLNRFMVGEALAALAEVDAVVALVECPSGAAARKPFAVEAGNRYVVDELARAGKPAVLAINKVDLLGDKRLLLPLVDGWHKVHRWAAIVPISAQSGDGVERLIDEVVGLLPDGEALFPEEMVTDRAERWLGAELIREQVFLLTKQEVPYAVAVTIDEWQERGAGRFPRHAPASGARKGDVMVSATVHVEKEAQKKIMVGERGRMIREIGTRARHEIARLLGCPVHLKLFVRVDAGWTGNPKGLRDLGYE
jgi:GTP-binding protein Era